MRCTHCQSDCVADARGRCPVCGEACRPEPVCGECDFVNPAGFRFCGQCGSALADPDASGAGGRGSRERSEREDADRAEHGNGRRRPASEGALVDPGDRRSARRGANLAGAEDGGGPAREAGDEAERRQLTILFCDLVGSTQLSHRLDPEDYHALLMAYRGGCVRAIEHYGGTEIRHVGDGTQAYFGYPRALEDAAERAVLTALDIVDAVARLARTPRWAGAALAVRVGIGSGPVITDRRSRPDGAGSRVAEALGETPNLAARIQSVAPTNAVVVGPLTRQLLGGLFTLNDLGEQSFKGIDRPVRIWQVIGRAAADRFEATRRPGARLIDRRRELAELIDVSGEARGGRGRVVVLSGDGGIGKSRLVRALHERLEPTQAWTTVALQCSPIYSNSGLYPIVSLVESLAELRLADDATARHERLARLLERAPEASARLMPLLAALLDIHGDAAPSAASIDWRELRERLAEVSIELLCELSARRPLLIVVEDLHWIDPSTGELLERVVRAIADCRVMIVAACRPEALLPWFGLGHVRVLAIEPLGGDDVVALASHMAGGRTLPREVRGEIIEKAGGVPLFVEEIVKTLMTSGLLEVAGGRCVLDGPLPPLAIPPTLTDSLMARLDQLGPERRFVQLGAVIGRDFTARLLAWVADEPPEAVETALGSLVASGVLGSRDESGQRHYTFNHALMRDAALESMLRSQRQRTHAVVARVLAERFPSLVQANPELLARHYTEGALLPEAIDHWLLAGRRASARSETLEAIAHLRRGLSLVPTDAPDEAMDTRRLALLIALGPALITHIGPGAEEVRDTYRDALALCERLPESAMHFAAHWGWWRISRNFGDKRDTADELLRVAERLGVPGLALEAHHASWATRFVLGEQSASLAHIDEGLALYAGGDYRHHASIYGGHDARVCAEGEAALALWLTGDARGGLERIGRAERLAERLEHVGSLAHAGDYALMFHGYRRDIEAVRDRARAQIELASAHRFDDYEMRALVFLGWALGLQGERDAGLVAIRKGMLAQRSSGTTEDFPIFFAMQAEVHLRYGQGTEAEAMLLEASDYAAERQVRLWDAEIHRLRAVVELGREGPAARERAVARLREALEIARRQEAIMLEYKAAETVRWAFGGTVARDGGTDGGESGASATDPASLERAMLAGLRGERDVVPLARGTDDDPLALLSNERRHAGSSPSEATATDDATLR